MPYIMKIFADGGCRNNGHPGAYGAAAVCFKDRHGNVTATWYRDLPPHPRPTNQRAELTAIIIALRQALQKYRDLDGTPYIDVTIHSDSRYAVECMNTWIHRWSSNGWRNARGSEVVNRDLIEEAWELHGRVEDEGEVSYAWISREENVEADRAANEAMDEQWRKAREQDSDSDDMTSSSEEYTSSDEYY